MGTVAPFIALTDQAWFDYLSSRADAGRVDEVNFWSPRSTRPMKRMTPGEPVFLRLKAPHHAIAGYGFFAHFGTLSLAEAWATFGWKNGDPDEARFLSRIRGYRGAELDAPDGTSWDLGCTVLREVRFWSQEGWIPWGSSRGCARRRAGCRAEC